MQQKHFSGILTALATPFLEDDSIDFECYRRLVQLQKRAGISGLIVGGTTGESPTLTTDELCRLAEIALSEGEDSFRIYVGTGSNDTKRTLMTTQAVLEVSPRHKRPIDGVMAVVPYYNKPSQAGLRAHFGAIAAAFPKVPLCVYNVPSRTGTALSVSTFLKICSEHENVAAIKEAAGDLNIIAELRRGLENQGLSDKVTLLSGDDLTFAPALVAGAEGLISVSANLIPEEMVAALRAGNKGQLEHLRLIHLKTHPLHQAMFTAPNPVPLKWAMSYLGLCQNRLRLPLTPLDSTEAEPVKRALEAAQVQGLRLLHFKP